MSMRLYWSPIVGTGTTQNPIRAALEDKAGILRTSSVIQPKPPYTVQGDLNVDAGKPVHSHALVLARATDWSNVEADPAELLLAEFPDGQRFIERIKSATVANLSSARRTAWLMVLGDLGAPTGDITGATPMIRVLRRLFRHVDQRVWEEGLNV
ncbi:MAG: hypothetical protein IIB57_08380 [Planctomycetes bacterium]|nr:hypothetical protein [Planctomycetota bacterium]